MQSRIVHFRSLALAALALSVGASATAAQDVDPRCTDPDIVGPSQQGGDACQKAVDLLAYMTPQLGTLIAGGNATVGQGGTLGGLGHVKVSVRANGMRAGLPDIGGTGVRYGAAQRSDYTVEKTWAGLPTVDAAIGLFKGIPLPLTNVLGIDALLNVSYLPELRHDPVEMTTPDGSFKIGYGARIGVLQESIITPGVSVTWVRRQLPRTTLVASWDASGVGGADTARLESFAVKSTSWRLVASKSLMLFGLAVGAGQDTYDASASASYAVNGTTQLDSYEGGPFGYGQKVTRTNIFADMSANLPFLKLVGTIGRVSGGDVATYNRFEPDANSARLYGSIGVLIGR